MSSPRPSRPSEPSPPVSPEQGVDRNPQNGQARTDPSLVQGDAADLPDGGAGSARHTGDQARQDKSR